jgi:glycosyltransferase involved in cell wall biosynthesis
VISIIIPCYNEVRTIKIILKKINDLKNYRFEIIIIDDYSTDGTREILKNEISLNTSYIVLYNEKNYGKGYCIKKGIEKSSGEIILIQDADLEYDPNDYNKLIDPIINDQADVVYGSRFIGGDKKRVLFFWHTIANKILTLISNIFTNLNLTDMECGYKVFRSSVLKKITLKQNGFGFEPEVTAKISKMNIKIFEVGVSYFGRSYLEGKKITYKDALNALYCIVRYNLSQSL